jgi:hemerythrin
MKMVSMGSINTCRIQDGVHWVEIPDADLRLLCGSPADSIKHLSKQGLLRPAQSSGIRYESGPNAILLSDVLVQNGQLANLSEFPAYHMFYTQGLIIPNHPNYFNPKPMLIGAPDQVKAQLDYITWGNYGLTRERQFLSLGETPAFARENVRMKRGFAPGQFFRTQDLMEVVELEDVPRELRGGVTIRRLRQNLFEIGCGRQSVEVDLALKPDEAYQSTFELPIKRITPHTFSVTHAGEGDGWNPSKPSVSSIIQYKGQFLLVDAGPFVLNTLNSLGLKPADLAGVFMTHVHDDHFAGLYDLMTQPNNVRLFVTPVVKATVVGKLAALLSTTVKQVQKRFEFVELNRDTWNRCLGLEVKPVTTAHPVDTTILIFRARKGRQYRTYGHYSDIAALNWLRRMVTTEEADTGVSRSYVNAVRRIFGLKLNLKKVDVGGPPIHGNAEDFAGDRSDRLVLCHTHTPFTTRELEIGAEVEYGQEEVLID